MDMDQCKVCKRICEWLVNYCWLMCKFFLLRSINSSTPTMSKNPSRNYCNGLVWQFIKKKESKKSTHESRRVRKYAKKVRNNARKCDLRPTVSAVSASYWCSCVVSWFLTLFSAYFFLYIFSPLMTCNRDQKGNKNTIGDRLMTYTPIIIIIIIIK